MKIILISSIPFFVLTLVHLCLTFLKEQKFADRSKCFLMPLLMIVPILTFCLQKNENSSILIPIFLVLALFFGCLGDFFMLKPDYAMQTDESEKKKRRINYLMGILTFAIGHAFYITLIFLTTEQKVFSLPLTIILPIVYVIFVTVMYFMIKKPNGFAGFATVAYACVLMGINFLCLNPIIGKNYSLGIFLRLAGNLLFLLSDSTISLTIFARDFKGSRFVIMITYLAAQYLLTMSFLV